MQRQLTLMCFAIASFILPAVVAAQDYTIDPMSNEKITNLWDPADIIFKPGLPPIRVACRQNLGLMPGGNIDAFSYGVDPVLTENPLATSVICFSVTRQSTGVLSTVVDTQAMISGNGAAGDQFVLRINGAGIVQGRTLRSDATAHGLTPRPNGAGPMESELDGHSNMRMMPIPGRKASPGIAFSVDQPTAMTEGVHQADILYRDPAIIAPPPPPGCFINPPAAYRIFATRAQLGLLEGDNINALAMWDINAPGTLSTGDVIYVSLDTGSTTLTNLGAKPSSMIRVFPTPIMEVITPEDFGLKDSDDIDALTLGDPEPCFGDVNWDGEIDINDVAPFATALADQLAFVTANPTCSTEPADMTGDWQLDGSDLDAFIQAVLLGETCD